MEDPIDNYFEDLTNIQTDKDRAEFTNQHIDSLRPTGMELDHKPATMFSHHTESISIDIEGDDGQAMKVIRAVVFILADKP